MIELPSMAQREQRAPKDRHRWRGRGKPAERWLPFVIIALIGTLGAFAAYRLAADADDARVRGAMELRAEWRARDFERKLLTLANPVEFMAVLVASEDTVDPQLFRRFAARAHTRRDPVRRIVWAPRVLRAPAETAASTSSANRPAPTEGGNSFPAEIEQTFAEGKPLGVVDLAGEQVRRSIIEQSRDEARPLSTPPLPLFNSSVIGYALFWPVYQGGEPPRTVEERRQQLRGVIEGTFGLEAALNAAIEDTPPIVESISFFVGQPTPSTQPVAAFDPKIGSVRQGGRPPGKIADDAIRISRSFDVFGQQWTLFFDFDGPALSPLRSSGAWAFPAGVLLLTAILLAYLAREQGYRREVESRVDERTAELRRTNRELNAIIETSPVGIFMTDRDGVVRQWNASAERIFGYTEDEALGRLPPYLTEVHMAEFQANLARAVSEASPTGSVETQRQRNDGAVIDVSASWARVSDEVGQLLGVMYAVSDITERKKIESQLQQAQKMEAIGNLTGGMAHDFNNLLSIIIGNIDLLRDRQKGDPDADELSREALDAALRGADLTRRLLAFARRQPLRPTRADVNGLIAGIVKLLERTLGEQVQITLDLNPETWPVVVDPAQLESGLTNLATNARDAMPGGGQLIIVTGNRSLDADYASQHAEVQPGDYAMIEVSDTGTGMPAEVASRIFEPFYTTKEPGQGTGLGLSMVFGFIKQSGGHINVYSEIGIGTTFRLYLPRADADAEADAAVLSPVLARGSGETVLAVEDNASLRRVVARQLAELGYRVVEAQDVETALQLLESERVDLVFTDVVMPGGASGYDLARTVLTRWPAIKIVLTSGFPENKVNGDANQPNLRLLSKPYRRDELGRLIRDILDS